MFLTLQKALPVPTKFWRDFTGFGPWPARTIWARTPRSAAVTFTGKPCVHLRFLRNQAACNRPKKINRPSTRRGPARSHQYSNKAKIAVVQPSRWALERKTHVSECDLGPARSQLQNTNTCGKPEDGSQRTEISLRLLPLEPHRWCCRRGPYCRWWRESF